MKLSDTQLVILQSGARDPERLCSAGAKLGAAPRGAIARKLIALGLAEAVPAPADAPAERRFPSSDKAGAAPMLLRITDAGLRAIGVEPEEERRAKAADAPDDALEAAMEAPRDARAAAAVARIAANAPRTGRAFWRAAEEAFGAGESYDRAAQVMHERVEEAARRYREMVAGRDGREHARAIAAREAGR